MTVKQTVEITNKLGMHARPAMTGVFAMRSNGLIFGFSPSSSQSG